MIALNTTNYNSKERDRRWRMAQNFMDEQAVDTIICYGSHEDCGSAPYTFDNWFTDDPPG
jgi:hypothetical protein